MGKVVEDKIIAQSLEPIVLNPNTVNAYRESIALSNDELEIANNVIFGDGVIEKILGTTKGNSDTPGNPVTGLHRSYGKTTEKACLRLANGILKSGPAAFGTTVLSGLSTTKITPFINLRGKSYGINETDGIIRYDPKKAEGIKCGILGPYLRKKIAFFESDESWTGANTDHYRADEFSGNASSSVKVSVAGASGNTAVSNTTFALDLSQFGNGKASIVKDYICFYTLHSIRNNIDKIRIEFSTGDTTYNNKYLEEITRDKFTEGDFEWTLHKIKKGGFDPTGSPNWNAVKAIRLTVFTNANGGVDVYFDYMYMRIQPLVAIELSRILFDAENSTNETYSGDSVVNYDKSKVGNASRRVAGTAGGAARTIQCDLGTAVDLSTWPDGTTSQGSDEIVFYIQTNDISALNNTNPLILRLGQSNTVYWSYTWTTKALLGLTGNDQWFEIRVKKSAFSAVGGITDWTGIDYIYFVTSALTGTTKYIYFDYLHMEQYNAVKQISDFETDETWVVTGNGEISNDKNGAIEGSKCLKLWALTPGKMSESSALLSLAANINLTQWDDATASSTDDYITFWLFHQTYNQIDFIEIWFDNNSLATFANAYKYRVNKTEFAQGTKTYNKNNLGTEIRIAKSSFEQIGTSGGWSTVRAIKFIVNSKGGPNSGSVLIDNLQMKRKKGITGRYYYKYCFMVKDVASHLSEISDYVDIKGSHVSLTNVMTSADTRVTARRIYRLGGTYPYTWMLAKMIEDNTTTEIVDDLDDEDLTYAMGDEIPIGAPMDIIKGNNLVYDPLANRVLYWGDPGNKNRVYYSHRNYFYAVDELGYREFPDEVMHVVPWYSQDIIFFKHNIKKIVGDFLSGELVDLPIPFGTCSYWSVSKIMNTMIAFAGWDNIYLFDGYRATAIGDGLRNYFKGRESYLSTVNIGYNKESVYIACKDKTGTPTYNNVVLKYNITKKSWSIIPSWNVNVWSNWNQLDDQNEFYYGDSNAGDIYSINSATYRFGSSAITSTIETGWMSVPDSEIALYMITIKAKGTAAGQLVFSGYKNLDGSTVISTGTISLTTTWKTYTIGPVNLYSKMRGDFLKLKFAHATDNAYFKAKDIVIYIEKLPKRQTLNEVAVS